MAKEVRFYFKSTCGTCKKAREYLLAQGCELRERDLIKEPLREPELRALIGMDDIAKWLNPRSALYRERNMKAEPPETDEAIALMLEDPNLIQRPVMVYKGRIYAGFNEKDMAAFLK